MDFYENNAYELMKELNQIYKCKDKIFIEIISITNYQKMNILFKKYMPDIVFHAAAHKHVVLMENSADEAIKNNIFGTVNMVKLSHKYHIKKFIFISTDKAVNPICIMGKTKKICEIYISSFYNKSKTIFSVVRFGNILNSSGSVLPIFKNQIKLGGPITITDINATRYFMNVKEAAFLVLSAGKISCGNELFIFDMGNPIKIFDLAVNLIKEENLIPYEDIKISYSGINNGEKINEELHTNKENLKKTEIEKIKYCILEKQNFMKTNYLISQLKLFYKLNNNKKLMHKIDEIINAD